MQGLEYSHYLYSRLILQKTFYFYSSYMQLVFYSFAIVRICGRNPPLHSLPGHLSSPVVVLVTVYFVSTVFKLSAEASLLCLGRA